MPKHGKKYVEAAKLVEHERQYSPTEALDLVKKTAYTKFDGTVEVHLQMGLDPRQADQQVRGVVLLPSGSGKQVRILVFAEGDGARLATEAGADYVGSDELVQKIQGGWFEFDVTIATPPLMGKVGRLGKLLGTRGLMPSPKSGTIVQPEDLPRVIKEARLGRAEFRLDKTANIHVAIGKSSFTLEQLTDNLGALMEALQRSKPSGAKGLYIKKISVAATMGPGVRVDVNQAMTMKVA